MPSIATSNPWMWVEPEDDPRSEEAPDGEIPVLKLYLTNYRLTLELKCDGLTPELLATRAVAPSTLSLLGLIRHMADVEHNWFQRVINGTGEPRLMSRPDDPDWDFNGAVGTEECVTEAMELYHREIGKANVWVDALTTAELDRRYPFTSGNGDVSGRDVVVHMIEEYARHCGHADLIREAIDGRTGQ